MIFNDKGEGRVRQKVIFHDTGGRGGQQNVILYEKGNLGVRHRCFSPTKSGNLDSGAFWNLCDPSLIGFLKVLTGDAG